MIKKIIAFFSLLVMVSTFASFKETIPVNATQVSYYVVPYNVGYNSIVSGRKYLLCQATAYAGRYEVMNGATNSTKQILFSGTNYTSWDTLKSDAKNRTTAYVTLTNKSGNDWYIQRNYDSKYLCSDSNSDLVFQSSNSASGYYTYFTAQQGSNSSFVKFLNCKDSSLYLGTKDTGAYFDTWHDQVSSVAVKDFALFSVFSTYSEASNYYGSIFNDTLLAKCDAQGSTDVSTLLTPWSSMSNLWNLLDSSTKYGITNATASSSGTLSQQCKAKYLYIYNKYNKVNSSINNFMGLTISAQTVNGLKIDLSQEMITIICLFGISIISIGASYKFRKKH